MTDAISKYDPTILYHHGIKGQKWGVRRFQNKDGSLTNAGKKRSEKRERKTEIRKAKTEYKQARSDYKKTVKSERRSAGLGIGIEGIARYQKAQQNINKAGNKVIDAYANVGKAKGGEKGEFKAYRKQMQVSGLPGSGADKQYQGRSTSLYNHIKQKKGKDYADRVLKDVQNTAYRRFATAMAVTAGSYAVSIYLASRD